MNETYLAKIAIIIYKSFLCVVVNAHVLIFRGLDTRGGRKLRNDTRGTTTVYNDKLIIQYDSEMAAPLEVSKKCSNFRIRQFKEKRHFNNAANLTFNMMVSFVIRLIACTARVACADRQTVRHTHTHETTTVTLTAHACRGLIISE